MFEIGKPLGWDESYRDNPDQQKSFIDMASKRMGDFDDKTHLFFNDVLDNVALYYVIAKEYTAVMDQADLNSSEEFSEVSSIDSEESEALKIEKQRKKSLRSAKSIEQMAKRGRTLSSVIDENIS
jgi:hypothetical protein